MYVIYRLSAAPCPCSPCLFFFSRCHRHSFRSWLSFFRAALDIVKSPTHPLLHSPLLRVCTHSLDYTSCLSGAAVSLLELLPLCMLLMLPLLLVMVGGSPLSPFPLRHLEPAALARHPLHGAVGLHLRLNMYVHVWWSCQFQITFQINLPCRRITTARGGSSHLASRATHPHAVDVGELPAEPARDGQHQDRDEAEDPAVVPVVVRVLPVGVSDDRRTQIGGQSSGC